jgi:multiple sugar transport system substrate-binding protein
VGDTSGDLLVADPIAGPHGDKATIVFPNNIMMYKNTPSQEASEEFLVYYLGQLKELWKQKLMSALPVFKSITELPEFSRRSQQREDRQGMAAHRQNLRNQGNKLNATSPPSTAARPSTSSPRPS